MRTKEGILTLAAGLLCTAMLTAPAFGEEAAPMDAAEHQSMAKSYQDESKEAAEKVASHTLMLNRYKTAPILPKGSPLPKREMVNHCQKLVDAYKQAATEAGSLAKLHQQAAGSSAGH